MASFEEALNKFKQEVHRIMHRLPYHQLKTAQARKQRLEQLNEVVNIVLGRQLVIRNPYGFTVMCEDNQQQIINLLLAWRKMQGSTRSLKRLTKVAQLKV